MMNLMAGRGLCISVFFFYIIQAQTLDISIKTVIFQLSVRAKGSRNQSPLSSINFVQISVIREEKIRILAIS